MCLLLCERGGGGTEKGCMVSLRPPPYLRVCGERQRRRHGRQVCVTVDSSGAAEAARAESVTALFRPAAGGGGGGGVIGTQRPGNPAGAARLVLPAMTTLEQMQAEIKKSPAKVCV